MSLKIRSVVADPVFLSNCFIVACPETGEGVVIDPGSRVDSIARAVEEEGVGVRELVCTHGHLDHVSGAAEARRLFGVPLALHEGARSVLSRLNESAMSFGVKPVEQPEVDRWLAEGDKIEFGNRRLTVIHTPGHSPGGISLLAEGHLFCGDTIFASGIGRWDFKGGDYETLINSIRDRILTLPPDTVLHPGHGPDTTVAAEAAGNPFLQ